jgi:hypothetical protein
MNITEKAARILAKQGFMSINGASLPGVSQNGGLTNTVKLPIYRVCSQNEHSSRVSEYKPKHYWLIYCSHERLWSTKCAQCERVGITPRDRVAREAQALTQLVKISLRVTP